MKVVRITGRRVREALDALADDDVTAVQRDEDAARERAEVAEAVAEIGGRGRPVLRVLPGGRPDSVASSWPDGSEAA